MQYIYIHTAIIIFVWAKKSAMTNVGGIEIEICGTIVCSGRLNTKIH